MVVNATSGIPTAQVPALFTQQLLMSPLILTPFLVFIPSAILSGGEFDTNTWAIRLTSRPRTVVASGKILAMVLWLIVVLLGHLVLGLFFDLSGGNLAGMTGGAWLTLFHQSILLFYLMLCWATFALAIGLASGSFWASFLGCLGYFFVDKFLSRAAPEAIRSISPAWNTDSILDKTFPVSREQGFLGFPAQDFADLPSACVVMGCFLMISAAGYFIAFHKRSLPA
jgi:hypothetical protein